MDSDVFALLKRKAEEYDEQVKDFLADGSIKSMEEYSRVVGRLEGIALMYNEIKAIEQRFIQD